MSRTPGIGAALGLALLAFACTAPPRDATKEHAVTKELEAKPGETPRAREGLVEGETGDATKTEEADIVELEGVFDIERLAGYKRFQGSWLYTDGGRYVLSYRPMPEYTPFVERRVVARGAHYTPWGQAISARHFRVDSMRLADGETPRDDVEPGQLPIPPTVRTRAEFERREDRSLQLFATLVSVTGDNANRREITLRLDDGALLESSLPTFYLDQLERDAVGERVTILGTVYSTRPQPLTPLPDALAPGEPDEPDEPGEPDEPYELRLNAETICLGEVHGCGLRQPEPSVTRPFSPDVKAKVEEVLGPTGAGPVTTLKSKPKHKPSSG